MQRLGDAVGVQSKCEFVEYGSRGLSLSLGAERWAGSVLLCIDVANSTIAYILPLNA